MKKLICVAACVFALSLAPVFGQPTATQPKPLPAPEQAPPPLTEFNLDFPGGTPAELVKAIEKAMGKPLNAIIPTEDAGIQLPPLKMNDVVAPQLFAALEAASRKVMAVSTDPFGTGTYSQFNTGYGFKTADKPLTDASIWYFHAEKPSLPPMISTKNTCRFYSLDSYLNRGFTVDDITTAIKTGWKMVGVTPPPELNYHKETKLLIAYGEPSQLETIDNVLKSLPATTVTRNEINEMKKQVQSWTLAVTEWQNKIMSLDAQVYGLNQRFDSLSRLPPAPPTNAPPAEKSGK